MKESYFPFSYVVEARMWSDFIEAIVKMLNLLLTVREESMQTKVNAGTPQTSHISFKNNKHFFIASNNYMHIFQSNIQ